MGLEYETGFILERDIDSLVAEAYHEVAIDTGIMEPDMYFSRRCEQVVERLSDKLKARAVPVEVMKYGGWDVTSHHFLRIAGSSESVFVGDPTWQQFLESPDPNKPRFLFVKEEDLVSTLSNLGIPASEHHIWLKPLGKQK